jgi:hypothetical protein
MGDRDEWNAAIGRIADLITRDLGDRCSERGLLCLVCHAWRAHDDMRDLIDFAIDDDAPASQTEGSE